MPGGSHQSSNVMPVLVAVGTAACTGLVLWWLYNKKSRKPNNPVTLKDPDTKYPLKLIEKEEVSHDTRRFRFGLASEEHRLGLPVGIISKRQKEASKRLKRHRIASSLKSLLASGGRSKMVFVVNRPLLMNRQALCSAISQSCLMCFRFACSKQKNQASLKAWLRFGQMKVVVKAPAGTVLQDIFGQALTRPALTATLTRKWALEKAFVQENKFDKTFVRDKNDKNRFEPAVLCLLGPISEIDELTGHLKLL